MIKREDILSLLHAQVNVNGHIVGATVGSGMAAEYTSKGGADILLVLNAGRMRQMGRGSLASYFCYENNNEEVMRIGCRDILPLVKDTPVVFGLFASDPTISLYEYLKKIKAAGFSGITNFPTLSLIDGKFREALEENGDSFELEVEAIRLARYMDLFTVAFVTNGREAKQMAEAGADIVCAHLGLTKGGFLGANKYVTLTEATRICGEIYQACEGAENNPIRMAYAGPANTPIDMQYLYQNTACQGYIGGSTFDRIPVEKAILNTTRAFKTYGSFDENDPLQKIVTGDWHTEDYTEFVKAFINEHYMKQVQLGELALVAHVSPNYLSTKFKREVGCSFTEYLVRFRVNKAKELIETNPGRSFIEIAGDVGYEDYAQFSRMFKKYTGTSPTEYRRGVQHG